MSEIARQLRQSSTPTEALLWSQLRARQVNGRKWRRQQPIGPFIVDFFCAELSTVIEIDGDVHAGREVEDRSRQLFLEARGLRVIRFNNDDVINNLDGVMSVVWEICR